MSIATRTGDSGTTGLMYNRRVPKCHPRVEAYGCVDELNAALGLARAHCAHDFVQRHLLAVQSQLVVLMGELATAVEDLPRYVMDGFQLMEPDRTAQLDALVREIESSGVAFTGWATPGGNACSAALDLARTICRRAERRVCELHENKQLRNDEIIVFLNRLSDVLWLMARQVESAGAQSSKP
ncbi:MAG: cob(I)yrinic acid a,c-diamide adenosyltransferase [Verrucomicrobia bacterium]|nr:cob(I)yrinic acid a,c-diamide adenosyltransferase [Verrucomicrobiota bacterium]